MLQSWKNWCWKLELATSLTISGATIALAGNYALAQSNIMPDRTLGAESSTVTPLDPDSLTDEIQGGAIRGRNLFHSFLEFNVGEKRAAYFLSPNANTQNILTRVTGGNSSEILGRLGTRGGSSPNLFLINPNGILFGPNASLDVGGSFVASTASSLKFADETQFSATQPQTTPLLTVSVPTGLQFGSTAASIANQSIAPLLDSMGNPVLIRGNPIPVGLQVPAGRTLALVGGDVVLEGSNLSAEAGRIELGSVVGPGQVSLTPTAQGWALGYEDVQNFGNIQLFQGAYVFAPGESGGDIQVQGRRVTLTDGSAIVAYTRGSRPGGTLAVNASESVELSGATPNGRVASRLGTDTSGSGAAGELRITTKRLIVREGAQVSAGTLGKGQGGNLVVNASESVELSGATLNGGFISGLLAQTQGIGDAGNITITTGKLIAQDGAVVTAGTGADSTGQGGNLTVTADSVELSGAVETPNGQSPSGLFARTRGAGPAGNLTVSTGQLSIRDGAQVSVSGLESGDAGNLKVAARSVSLDNKGKLIATTNSGNGGNITLQDLGLLLLRNNSQISTTAGTAQAGGDGGNIIINALNGFIIAVPDENSDITADAFSGSGGRVTTNATGIFGLAPLSRQDLERLRPNDLDPSQLQTNDITAISQQNPSLSGTVEINTPDVDPSSGLVALPEEVVDVSGLVAQRCPTGGETAKESSEFVVTGRGGLPPDPSDPPNSDAVLAGWISLNSELKEKRSGPVPARNPTSSIPPVPLVEAQGWVKDSSGKVILTAQAPTVTPHSPGLRIAECPTPKTGS